jgi:hypothetical protein
MTLMTMPGKMRQDGQHTLLVMRDERRCQAVCIVDDGTIGDVTTKLGLIEAIASRKLAGGELAFDGRVWITPADMPAPAPAAIS